MISSCPETLDGGKMLFALVVGVPETSVDIGT